MATNLSSLHLHLDNTMRDYWPAHLRAGSMSARKPLRSREQRILQAEHTLGQLEHCHLPCIERLVLEDCSNVPVPALRKFLRSHRATLTELSIMSSGLVGKAPSDVAPSRRRRMRARIPDGDGVLDIFLDALQVCKLQSLRLDNIRVGRYVPSAIAFQAFRLVSTHDARLWMHKGNCPDGIRAHLETVRSNYTMVDKSGLPIGLLS
jgi:hypothetical protein